MRLQPVILITLAAAVIFMLWPFGKQPEQPSEEIVKPAQMAYARLAGTTSAMSLDYKWRRKGPDAIADFFVENFNTFEVTNFDLVCYLFDKDAKEAGKITHFIQSKLASNAKAGFAGILFRDVEPRARQAICVIENAKPWVQF